MVDEFKYIKRIESGENFTYLTQVELNKEELLALADLAGELSIQEYIEKIVRKEIFIRHFEKVLEEQSNKEPKILLHFMENQ